MYNIAKMMDMELELSEKQFSDFLALSRQFYTITPILEKFVFRMAYLNAKDSNSNAYCHHRALVSGIIYQLTVRDEQVIRQFWQGLDEILAPLKSNSADTHIPLSYYEQSPGVVDTLLIGINIREIPADIEMMNYYPEVDRSGRVVGIRAADDLEEYTIIDDFYVTPTILEEEQEDNI